MNNVEDQINNDKDQADRVVLAINQLKPNNDRKDRITYCRIVDDEVSDDNRSAYKSTLSHQQKHRAMAAQPGA